VTTVYNLAVEEAVKVLLLCGMTYGVTPERRALCETRMGNLFGQLMNLGISEVEFTRACREAGSHIGKTKAILDWIEIEGEGGAI
jgi:hypothetical protein